MKFVKLIDEQWEYIRPLLPEQTGRGRPRKNPKQVYADTKYSMPLNRFYLDRRKVRSQIPSTATKRRPGRPRLLDKATYKKVRYTVERFFAWTENFRKLTIRYERLRRHSRDYITSLAS